MEDDLTDDALAGRFRVFQRRRGHRYSVDDMLTAMIALAGRPEAPSCLDLGCGIGSVLLMLAYKLPGASLVGVEAQRVSYELARRNVERNGVGGRVELHLADLRDHGLHERLRGKYPDGFSLVTGTPPYQRPGAGTVSPEPQRAHARVELRGGVEDYLRAAGRLVSDDGLVVVCADARTPARVEQGAEQAGLAVLSRRDLIPISHKPALFSVWQLSPTPGPFVEHPPFEARRADGSRGDEERGLRRFFDLA